MVNELYHHGIKGQKWGVRRFQNPDGTLTEKGKRKYSESKYAGKTKNGEDMYLLKDKTPIIGKALSKVSPKIRDNINRSTLYDAYVNGKKVANIQLYQEDNKTVNGVWLDTKCTERGKGYANTVMDYVIHEAKVNGNEFFTLEVPGISPDARHIYEKKGFREVGKHVGYDENDIWGGLTDMKLDLRK